MASESLAHCESLAHWLHLVREEYEEMPGLSLTKAQMQRLWGLDPNTCDRVLVALETSHFLKRTPSNSYVRADRSLR